MALGLFAQLGYTIRYTTALPQRQSRLERPHSACRVNFYCPSLHGVVLNFFPRGTCHCREGPPRSSTHATQRQFVYTHRWRVHDLVIWDNRCTMHRGTDFDDLRWKRDMQRATVSDVANSCEQEGITIAAA